VVVSHLIDEYKSESALDLGTGSGNFELEFCHRLKKIVGVDYNDEALAFLSKKLKQVKSKNVKLVNANVLDAPKITHLGRFDMILMIDVLEHLEEKAAEKLITGFKKLLTRNGKVVIVTPNYIGFWPFMEKVIIDKFTNFPHLENMQHITKYGPENLIGVFKKNGFRVAKITTFNTFSYLVPSKDISAKLCALELKLTLPFGNLILGVFEA